MSALDDLLAKDWNGRTPIEKCIVIASKEGRDYQLGDNAEQAAAELAELKSRAEKAEVGRWKRWAWNAHRVRKPYGNYG